MTLAKVAAAQQSAARLAYSQEEAAALLGVGRSTIRKLVTTGELPSVRAGKRLLIPTAALERFLEGGK